MSKLHIHTTSFLSWIGIMGSCVFLLSLSSCGSQQHVVSNRYMRDLARAGIRLGIDIEERDNHTLLLEASKWIGTPYRNGGNSISGIDCSGLTYHIYKNVYKTTLSRRSEDQYHMDVRLKPGKRLVQGDLLFFNTSRSRKTPCDHVGIYLKEDKFIHASSSKGVIVSRLSESYWAKRWVSAGERK